MTLIVTSSNEEFIELATATIEHRLPEPATEPSTTVQPAQPVRARRARQQVAEEQPATSAPIIAQGSWPAITDKDKTPLDYKIGIELTMMPQVISEKGKNEDSRIVSYYASILDSICDRDRIHLHSRDPHRDGFAVEVPSSVLTTWGQVKTFYDTYTKHMLEIGLRPHNSHITSGGGHIHVGPLKVPTMVNLMRDIQNKPWLMWTFNEPDDVKSSVSFTKEVEEIGEELHKVAVQINANPGLFSDSISAEGRVALLFFGNPAFVDKSWLPDDKSKVCRYSTSHRTFEFRFFESPADWSEQEAHIRFTQAYVKWIETEYKSKHIETKVTKMEQLKAMELDECEKAFREFLTILGLPHAPYERMIKENLYARFKRGKRI